MKGPNLCVVKLVVRTDKRVNNQNATTRKQEEKHYNSRSVTLLFRVQMLILSCAFQKKTIESSVGRGKSQ